MKSICVLVLVTRVAMAEPSGAELASKANEAGKDLFGAQKLVEASGKFRAAVMLDPQPKYYFNLCEALYRRDVFAAALEACKAVEALHPPAELAMKTKKYISRIEADAAIQNASLAPVGATADGLDEDGVDLMFAGEYRLASDRFRAAADRDPQARYYFNLCTALYQQGVFGAALQACKVVAKLHPSPQLTTKSERAIKRIVDDATAQHIDLQPTSTTDAASAANREGEALRATDLEAARLKFRDAVARDPQASYFYNLCAVDAALGKPDEAADACKAVLTHKPSEALKAKANAWLAAAR
jgi:tetratricopeptide (TPR) repeat protein